MERILSVFNLLKRVGFAVLSFGTSVLAQPQAPIEWGDARVLLVPPDSIYTFGIAAQGDTIVLVGTRWDDDFQLGLAVVCVSGDNGQTWSPWHMFEREGNESHYTTIAFTSQGVLCCTSTDNSRAFYRSTNLGQSWVGPGPTRGGLRVVDTVGDTVWCSMVQNGQYGVTRTTNAGLTFSPILETSSPNFRNQAVAVSDSGIVAVDFIEYSPPIYLDLHVITAMRSESIFSEPARLNPQFTESYWSDVQLDPDGQGFILSACRYESFFPGGAAMMVNVTRDHGCTWEPPDTLNPVESGGGAYTAQDGHTWVAMWWDTTISAPYEYSGMWNTISGNRGRSWYPRRQAIGYPQLGGEFGNVDLQGNRVRCYMAFDSWDEVEQYYLQWEGVITPDTIVPVVTCGDLFSGEFPFESEVTLSACATDNDSLWQMTVVLRPLTRTDSLIILIPRDHDSLYTVTFELPFDTIGWSYYYVAEDMWEHRVFLPGVDPEHPIMLSVQPDSLFPVYLQGTLIDTTLRPNQVLDFTADVVDDDSVVSVTLALWHTTVQDTYWVEMIPNLGFPYWGSWVVRSDTGDWAMQYSAPDRWNHIAHYPETPHPFRVEVTSDVKSPDDIPNRFALSVFPTPFNSTLSIALDVSINQEVSVSLYDLLGREVEVIYRGRLASSTISYAAPASLSSGVYFVRAVAGNRAVMGKVVLLK